MTADEYLHEILASQALGDDSDEVKALQKHRADVEKLIRDNFKDTALTIRYAGSKAKGTMNKESYDLDIISYVSSGDNTAGETLEDIYENHKKALAKKYTVEPKGSALRLKGCDPGKSRRRFSHRRGAGPVYGRDQDRCLPLPIGRRQETPEDQSRRSSRSRARQRPDRCHPRGQALEGPQRPADSHVCAGTCRHQAARRTRKRRASRHRWSTSGPNCATILPT